MQKKRLYSIHSVFGGRDFYDENGQRIGYSVPSITGNGEDFVWSDGSHGCWASRPGTWSISAKSSISSPRATRSRISSRSWREFTLFCLA